MCKVSRWRRVPTKGTHDLKHMCFGETFVYEYLDHGHSEYVHIGHGTREIQLNITRINQYFIVNFLSINY